MASPDIPVVRPARVSDDERFLKWLARAKEALPLEAEVTAAQSEEQARDLDEIPEAIVVRKGEAAGDSAPAGTAARLLAGELPQARKIPGRRRRTEDAPREEEDFPQELDLSRITNFDDYNAGNTRVEPLQRSAEQEGTHRLKHPKFLDGKLPRSVERGVLYPQPVRLVLTAILLLLTKLLTIAVIITLPIVSVVDGRTLIPKTIPLLIAFGVVAALYVWSSNKTRCRVCSCHFFYVRHCHKHKSAHRIPLVGIACTAALHLLLFKWMRCMYCGTAIRLRGSTGVGKPKKDGEFGDEEEEDEGGEPVG